MKEETILSFPLTQIKINLEMIPNVSGYSFILIQVFKANRETYLLDILSFTLTFYF